MFVLLATADDRFVASVSRQYLFAPLVYLSAFILAFVSAWASVGLCLFLALFFALPIGHRAGAAGQGRSLDARQIEEPER